jgi:DNA primase
VDCIEEVESLELTKAELRGLKSVLVDAVAHDIALTRESLATEISRRDLGVALERATMLVRRARLWPALEEAASEDARDAFRQAMHLQRSAHSLNKELRAAETALASDPTEANHRHLVEIQAQLRNVQATEALIEGFGIQSGRSART